MNVVEPPAQGEGNPNPDQVQTVPFDSSPIVRTFFGDQPPHEKTQALPHEHVKPHGADSWVELARAPTRRLDSFAVEDPAPKPEPTLSEPAPEVIQSSATSMGEPESIEPRDLSSVFDKEALIQQKFHFIG